MALQADKPLIGITTGSAPTWRSRGKDYLPYALAIERAGGTPVSLGPRRRGRIEDCDGLLISGGRDVHPRYYDRRPTAEGAESRRCAEEDLSFEELKDRYSMDWDERRDDYELPVVERALGMGIPRYVIPSAARNPVPPSRIPRCARNDMARVRNDIARVRNDMARMRIPVLGICRGIQLLNVVLGRRLVPDLAVCKGGNARAHQDPHSVRIEPESLLGRILPGPVLQVNSYHHQGLDAEDIAPGLRAVAVAPDGVIEAVEGTAHPWLVAVQWHPERAADCEVYEACKPLFEEFVKAAARFQISDFRFQISDFPGGQAGCVAVPSHPSGKSAI